MRIFGASQNPMIRRMKREDHNPSSGRLQMSRFPKLIDWAEGGSDKWMISPVLCVYIYIRVSDMP